MGKSCNIENMKMFVEALNWGSYEQTQGTLRDSNPDKPGDYRYCCLGVATDLAVKAGTSEKFEVKDGDYVVTRDVWGTGYMSEPVMEWLGIKDKNPMLDFGMGQRMLAAQANDAYHQDFTQIGAAFHNTYLSSSFEEVNN
jgi:hypothetical protein